MKKTQTRRALLMSVLSLLLCCSMLIGTTFAWFTDTVESGKNQIIAGNLDIDLEYKQVEDGKLADNWTPVAGKTDIFDPHALWEPGRVEVVYLKVSNLGTLALKYQLGVNVSNETPGTNVYGEAFLLSNSLVFKVVELKDEPTTAYTREEAITEAAGTEKGLKDYNGKTTPLDAKDGTNDEDYVALIVYMPTTVGNEANYKTGTAAPIIELGINLFATQVEAESDSFGDDYDEDAPALTVKDTAELQAALDNASLGTTIQLTPGVAYGAVAIRPTAANVSKMVCNSHPETTYTDAAAFKAHMTDGKFHHVPYYTTELSNIKIIGAPGATIAGFNVASSAGTCHDYILDEDRYIVSYLSLNNLTFEDIAFTGKVNIESSLAESSIVGVTFDGCTFTTGGTAEANGMAIRYYNENNNGKVKDITVKNCTFTNCRQGVYVQNVNGVTVIDSTFDTTGHNAIGIQGSGVNLKDVVITGNVFKNIGDRIIRFNEVAADSNITIQNNVATNSGDDAGEVIKATSIAVGVTTSVKNNSWGTGKIVVNDELKDQNAGESEIKVSNDDALKIAINNGETNIELDAGTYTFPASSLSGDETLNCAPGTVFDGKSGLNINGATVVGATFSNPDDVAGAGTINGTFKDCVFEGSEALRWCYAGETVVFENCEFKTDFRGVHFDAMDHDVIFRNCKLNGFNAFGGNATVTFEGCTFGYDESRYNGLNMYCDTVLKNCKFEYVSGKTNFIDFEEAGHSLTIENCIATLDGEAAAVISFVGGTYKDQTTIKVNETTTTDDGMLLVKDCLTGAIILDSVDNYTESTMTVPENVTSLGNAVFGGSDIKEVEIPTSVNDFGASGVSETNASGGAFKNSNVEKVVLSEGMTEIPAAAFNGAAKLTSVNIPTSVKKIGVNAFRSTALTELVIPATVDEIAYGAFRDMTSLTTVTIEGDAVTLPGYVFRGCTNLRTVYLNVDSLTLNGSMNFANASSNNPNTNNITFYVKNESVADAVKAHMGVGSYVAIYVNGVLYAEIK